MAPAVRAMMGILFCWSSVLPSDIGKTTSFHPSNFPRGFGSVHLRHLHIHENQVEFLLLKFLHGDPAVYGFNQFGVGEPRLQKIFINPIFTGLSWILTHFASNKKD
jgi:hypothetical protein